MAEYTPGPWEVRLTERNDSANGAVIFGGLPSNRFVVAKMPRSADRPYGQKLADLSVIAAAPELLEALASIKWRSADRDNMEFAATITYSQMDAIRAAIAKATDGEG